MARTSDSDAANQDSIASCMDGVQVKIAEAYKPRRKIAPPACYNNRLPDLSQYHYDVSFENGILEKITEWKKVRAKIRQARKEREDEEKERELEKEKEAEQAKLAPPLASDVNSQIAVKVAPPPETTILTPQPLSPLASQIEDIKINGLDYSDFDNDTSSPFDNMELKTINDMEELAQVLQPTSSWPQSIEPKQSSDINEVSSHSELENEPKLEPEEEEVVVVKKEDIKRDFEDMQQLVLPIIQDLQKLLERPHREIYEPSPEPEPELESNSDPKLSTILSELSEEQQNLARRLNDMGFSLLRAARAIQTLDGQDNKNIVEYLLALQSLEDAGFDEEIAVKALELTQYDEQKAKLYCENLVILTNFGFSEDRASMALLKCDVDRDKALDLLIT